MNPNWCIYMLLQWQKMIPLALNSRLAWHAALQPHCEAAIPTPGAMETCFPGRLLEHQGTFALYLCTEGRKLGMHHRLNIHVKGGFDLHRPAIQLQDREFDDFLKRAKRKAAVHLKQTEMKLEMIPRSKLAVKRGAWQPQTKPSPIQSSAIQVESGAEAQSTSNTLSTDEDGANAHRSWDGQQGGPCAQRCNCTHHCLSWT